MVCGARASHSVAGVHAALIAAALGGEHHQHHDGDGDSAAHVPALQAIDCRCQQQREEHRQRHGNEDVLREIQHRPDGQHRKQDDGLAQGGVGQGNGCAHCATLGYPPRHQQAQRPLPKQDKRPALT